MRIYDFQLKSSQSGRAVIAAGGMALVVAAGGTGKVALLDSTGAASANPATLTNGRCTFRTADATDVVDIYLMTPTGHFVVLKSVGSGDRSEVAYDPAAPSTLVAIPFAAADYAAGAEHSTGIELPAGMLLTPNAAMHVTTVEAAKTLDVGLLSTEAGGDANGLIAAISLAAAGLVAAKSAATTTRGALLGGATLDAGHPTDGVAKTVSLTPLAGTAAAQGLILLPALVSPQLFV